MSTLKEVYYSDIFSDFEKMPITNDVALVTNARAIQDSVLSLLKTNFGDRLYHSEIGSNVNNKLFENVNPITASITKSFIETTINNFEPRITITDLMVTADTILNEFSVSMRYIILKQKTIPQTLRFKLAQ
jgi:phage baseplate assembly protein W